MTKRDELLALAERREPVVRVKELRWYPVDNRPATRAEALSAIGLYIVADLSGDGRFAVGLDNGACAAFLLDEAGDKQLRYATLDEAKSAAQADYEQRIRAAIEIAPQSDRQPSPGQKQISETGKELLKNTEQPMNNADVSVGELALLGSIAKAMRAEHDAGDGHFSTAEVEFMERHVARFRIERLDRLASGRR